jgi:outer membrane receptor protein involved in Fe transport
MSGLRRILFAETSRHALAALIPAMMTLPAAAQEAAPAVEQNQTAVQTPQQETETVVVTGSANPLGERKLTASFSITTADENQIREAAPSNTADLLKIVPGVFAETTGGTSGANIEVRGFPTGGDAPFSTIELDGSPVYASPTLSFLDNSSLFRIDDTVARVEVLRGGSSPIWSSGQPGVTVNFIQKNGETNPGGSARLTWGSGAERRIDAYYGGKIAEGWYGSVGGFYRTADGVRDTQYPADDGYQLEATLVHDLDSGKVSFYGRVTRDKNAFFTPIPLVSSNNGHSLSPFPGFDPRTGTLLGNANRYVTFETMPGATPETRTMDMSEGRGLDVHMFGMDFDKTFGPWQISNKAHFTEGDVQCNCLFTGNNPQTLGDYISAAVTRANSNPAVIAAAGGPATTGTASFVNTGTAIIDPTIQVINPGMWYVDKRIKSFTDDARVSREIFPGNTVTLGLYFASYSTKDTWQLGNTMLMTVENNARPINVTLDNGVAVTRNGIDSPSFYALRASYDGRNVAGTIADTWQITPDLKIDAGFRVENQTVDATIGNTSTADLDGNPLTLYDAGASYPNGTYTPVHDSPVATSWTAGVDYSFTETLNGFVRVNQGYLFPQFDDYRSNVFTTQHINQYEIGLKTVTDLYSVFLTGFFNKFWGQPQQQILSDGTQVNYLLSSRAFGVEFEGELRPFEHFQINVTGDYNNAEYVNNPFFDGNTVLRQPEWQVRLTPSYTMPVMDSGFVRAYVTYNYVGERWADVQNQQYMPAYNTFDVGVSIAPNDTFELDFTGTNVFNELGITEGNTRVLGSGVNGLGVFLGRPLFGATYEVSGVVRF